MGMVQIEDVGVIVPRTRQSVFVTTTFVGFHRWKEAPPPVEFLRNWHRHVFHVLLLVDVDHGDRQVEFFILKHELNEYLKKAWNDKHFEASCEYIATDVLTAFVNKGYSVGLVKVSEDGENGALVQNLSNAKKE